MRVKLLWLERRTETADTSPYMYLHSDTEIAKQVHWGEPHISSARAYITSQCHPGFVAFPQSAGRAVFPSELIDGAVIPAGAEILLFTWRQLREKREWRERHCERTSTDGETPNREKTF